MRLIIDSLVLLMILGILAGAVLHFRTKQDTEYKIEQARREVQRFSSQIKLQTAMGISELTPRGFPVTVDPEWFGGDLPTNPLLGRGHPWLEIARKSHRDLKHPVIKTASDHTIAQFWYNPYLGLLRARVPARSTDVATLKIYNRVNECRLPNLFASGVTQAKND